MMMIRRAMGAALIGLWLGGCSVVVFEDGPACPADTACPVGVTALDAATVSAEQSPQSASQTAPSQSVASSQSVAPSASPAASGQSDAKSDVSIDGYRSYFDYDSAVLSQETLSGLLFVADHLKANPALRILIEGHCDERGTRDYNIALGHKRADAVRVQLARLGVDRRRIKTKSYGKERPAVLGATAAAWAKNRRTVIRLQND